MVFCLFSKSLVDLYLFSNEYTTSNVEKKLKTRRSRKLLPHNQKPIYFNIQTKIIPASALMKNP